MVWKRETFRALGACAVLLAIALLAAPAGQARKAPRLIDRHGKQIHGRPARWLQQSHMPLVGGRIRLILGSCPHRPKFAGCVYSRRPRWLYLDMSAYNPKSVLYHELGHTFDFELLRRTDRKKFKRVLHLRKPGWFAGDRPPAELFAEAYALCSRFGMKRPAASKLNWTHSLYHYRPSRKQHKASCTIIKRAGAPARQKARPKPQPPRNPPPVIEEAPPQKPSNQPEDPLAPVLPPPLPVPVVVGV